MIVDFGTGTGHAVLRRARREPTSLVIGIDAEASAMADASRRAAANAWRGGLANAIFLAETPERLPGPLAGCADLVTVILPWGSLLRGVLRPDHTMMPGLSGVLRNDGELVLFLSDIDRAQVEALATDYRGAGLATTEVRPATAADVMRCRQAGRAAWASRVIGRLG